MGLTQLIAQFEQKEEAARLANLKREEQITAIFDEIIARYQPGGTFERAGLAQIEAEKVRGVGKGYHDIISSGLAGTEAMGGVERRWESEVGAPSRLKLEDIMMERLSSAQMGKAGFLERIQEPYPDAGPLYQAAAQLASVPRYQPTSGLAGRESLSGGWVSGAQQTLAGGGSFFGQPAHGTVTEAEQGSMQEQEGTAASGYSLAKAAEAYKRDVQAANPNADVSHITGDYYKQLLEKTPYNPERGVWKAYAAAGGAKTTSPAGKYTPTPRSAYQQPLPIAPSKSKYTTTRTPSFTGTFASGVW